MPKQPGAQVVSLASGEQDDQGDRPGSSLSDLTDLEQTGIAMTRWLNWILARRGLDPISVPINEALVDGLRIVQFAEIVTGKTIGRYNKRPRMLLQRLENTNKAMEHIQAWAPADTLWLCSSQDLVNANNMVVTGYLATVCRVHASSASLDEVVAWMHALPGGNAFPGDFLDRAWVGGELVLALVEAASGIVADDSDKAGPLEAAMNLAEQRFALPRIFTSPHPPQSLLDIFVRMLMTASGGGDGVAATG